jgi:hypothetical protein
MGTVPSAVFCSHAVTTKSPLSSLSILSSSSVEDFLWTVMTKMGATVGFGLF